MAQLFAENIPMLSGRLVSIQTACGARLLIYVAPSDVQIGISVLKIQGNVCETLIDLIVPEIPEAIFS